jgi:hypothetical protein
MVAHGVYLAPGFFPGFLAEFLSLSTRAGRFPFGVGAFRGGFLGFGFLHAFIVLSPVWFGPGFQPG